MKIIFTWLLVGWSVVSFAQTTPPKPTDPANPTDPVKPKVAAVVSGTALLPNITPKAPTSAALERYGNYPVSLYTGLPTIEIPIYEIRIGNLVIPIKLTYHASGNKVNDLTSWVGLGWSLQTGGMITRNMLGLPDETLTTGILGKSVVVPSINTGCQSESEREQLQTIVSNQVDTQRDLFTYSLPIGSNVFVITSPTGYNLLSPEPIQLAYSSSLSSFTLTDTMGNLFRFADTEVIGTPAYISSWMLSEITGLNPAQRVTYTYQTNIVGTSPEPYDVVSLRAEVNDQNVPAYSPGIISRVANNDAAPTIGSQLPKEIVFPGGKIQFVLETATREGGKGLDYIDVFGYNVATNTYSLIKRYDLVYSSPFRKRSDGTNDVAVALLDQVRLLQGDGVTSIGSYSFTYNSLALPPAASRAKDFWGYYNGQTGLTLIPTQSFTYQQYTLPNQTATVTIGDANRDPDETKMQAWMLRTIRYPTGGTTSFSYATNRYGGPNNTTLLAGGLRVERIQSYDETGQFVFAKRYAYGTNESGLGTPRFMANGVEVKPRTIKQDVMIQFVQKAGTALPYSYSYRMFTFSSAPSAPLMPREGSPVTYSEVAEYNENATGGVIGKTIYRYRDADVDAVLSVAPGKYFVTSRSWSRGQLQTRLIYESSLTPGQYILKSRLENTYSAIPSGTSVENIGFLLAPDRQEEAYSLSGGCVDPPNLYRGPVSYGFSYGTMRLTQTSEYAYEGSTASVYTLKTTETGYSGVHYQPTETRTYTKGNSWVPGSIQIGTRYSYPQDFGPIPTTLTNPDPELVGIRTLQQRNAYIPVEVIDFQKDYTKADTARTYKTGKLTTYTAVTVNGLATPLPLQVYLSETTYANKVSIGTGNYSPSAKRYLAAVGNQFPIDPIWNPRLRMNSYDAGGNLTSYSLTAGATTTYTYGNSTPAGGVPLWYVTKAVENATQASALTTSYTYFIPILGPATMVDPRGVTTFYEYDAFGRLARIRDNAGNVLKQYSYRYATAP